MPSEVLCYNKGCGSKFDPNSNKEGSCIHHPGVPVFHDALKGWSCCKRRTTDFSDFLNIPGCSKGLHSNVKPEPVAPKVTSSKNRETSEKILSPEPEKVTPKPIKTVKTPRPCVSEPMIPLPIKTTPSLQKALQKLSLETANEDASKQIKICKFLSCRTTYSPGISEICIHHPGGPVFHEGMKYWSCCQRKTSDFTSFLAQEGCVTGTHEWKVKSLAEAAPCRYDWHQTGSVVVLSVFAKMALEENSSVKVNQVAIEIDLEFEGGKRNFKLELDLEGVIDPSRSFVTLYGTKVEITLKKGDASHWKKLNIIKIVEEAEEKKNVEIEEENVETPEKWKESGEKNDNDDDSDLSGIDDVEFD